MHKSKLKGITLAVLLAFAPMAAQAAGLGRLTVTSGLGEPLSAEIELLSTTPDELASLSAGIAPQEAYNVQGVERTPIHNAIKVNVEKRADGTPVLKLTTSQAVSDPFLDMLIQVDWATGRLLREYTVLLDPPGYSNQAQVYNGVQLPPTSAATAVQPTPSAGPAAQAPQGSANTNVATQRAPASAAPVRTPPPPISASPETYTTTRGDTLSDIARQHQVQGVSLDQMLVGLYRANEDAFAGKNMNRLKVGQILRVPNASELSQVTASEATQEVRVQTADWNAYRNRLANLAAESTPSVDGGPQQSASGRISTPATDQAAPPVNGPRDVVKLSSSDAAGNASQAQLNAMQEELTAKEKSLKEAAERTAMLEKQISDMQKLLAIKNQALANLQNNDEVAVTPEVPVADSQTQPSNEHVPEETELAPPENAVNTEPTEDAAAPASSPEQKPEPVVPAAQPPIAEPSFFDEFVGDDPLPLALAGGGIVLLLGGWLYMRNRRKRELDSFEKGILTAGGLKPNTVFGNTSGATVNTGDTSFLNDFSQNTGGMIDTHDVDPIAEAEVYMAYGRDAQAEEILKDAIVKEPQRHELHLKLLEIYASRNDTSAFETVAGEIYTTLGADDPVWAKVATLGRKLEPDNPLYAENNETKPAVEKSTEAAAANVTSSTVGQGNVLAAGALAGAAILATSNTAEEEVGRGERVEEGQTADTEIDTSSVEENVEDFPALDFDFDTAEQAKTENDTVVDDVDPHDGNSLDFSLDLPEPPAKNSLQLDIDELDAAIPDFDLPELPDNGNASATVEQDAVPEFSIPELDDIEPVQTDTPLATPDVDLDFPEIDLPEIELPQPVSEAVPAVEDVQDDGLGDIDFDLPEISFAETDEPLVPEQQVNSTNSTPSVDLSDDAAKLDLDSPLTESEPKIEAGQHDEVPHFDFGDIDLGGSKLDAGSDVTDAEEIVFPDVDLDAEDDTAASPGVADIDLSNISLDVAEHVDANEATESDIVADEPADVDTKLDLVTAYMDMGDNEGARELLEEILKEGGPKQKQKAQSILDDLP